MVRKGFSVLALAGVLVLMASPAALAIPITYVNANFEGGPGDLGGGIGFPGWGLPTNVSPSNLDGRALEFALQDQLEWARGALSESTIHRVSFDYFAETDANVTQFLDVPNILRLDVSEPGRHNVEVLYNLSTQTANAYLDGALDNSLLTILVFPSVPVSTDIRIINQRGQPGGSGGVFQIDNLVWEGWEDGGNEVPEPTTLTLMVLSLLGLAARRRQA